MKTMRTLAMVLFAAAVGPLAPAPAYAQPTFGAAQPTTDPQAADPAAIEEAKNAARELGDEGYDFFEKRDYKRAIERFRAADARFHAPPFLVMQAHAHVELNQLVEARALYKSVANETLPEGASEQFQEAQAVARKRLPLIEARIPSLRVRVKGIDPKKVTIAIDNVEMPSRILDEPVPQNPGTRKVVASVEASDGGRAAFQTVVLKEGTTKTITIAFRAANPVQGAQTPKASGGCASCEVASPRDGGGVAVLSALALALSAIVRRRRRARL